MPQFHSHDLADKVSKTSIVAVHGINGDARRTWTSVASNVCWLNHTDLLPKYIKNARVLVWGYNANVTSSKGRSTSADRILQHAQTLVAQLQADREVRSLFRLLYLLLSTHAPANSHYFVPLLFNAHGYTCR